MHQNAFLHPGMLVFRNISTLTFRRAPHHKHTFLLIFIEIFICMQKRKHEFNHYEKYMFKYFQKAFGNECM